MPSIHRNISFASGGLRLEGVLHLPGDSGKFSGVAICHPHPRYGGDMHSSVVVGIARSLCEAGLAALRFNYRGVGGSEGDYDGGDGESRDAEEAVGFLSLQEGVDGSRIGIAGYSFGAWMALEAASSNNLAQAVASVACPIRPFTEIGVREILQPKLLILGEHDHDFPVEQFRFLSKRFIEPKEVEVVQGADHFFGGHIPEVGKLAAEFFTRWLM